MIAIFFNHQLYVITRTWLVKTSIGEYWLIVTQSFELSNFMPSYSWLIVNRTLKHVVTSTNYISFCNIILDLLNNDFVFVIMSKFESFVQNIRFTLHYFSGKHFDLVSKNFYIPPITTNSLNPEYYHFIRHKWNE